MKSFQKIVVFAVALVMVLGSPIAYAVAQEAPEENVTESETTDVEENNPEEELLEEENDESQEEEEVAEESNDEEENNEDEESLNEEIQLEDDFLIMPLGFPGHGGPNPPNHKIEICHVNPSHSNIIWVDANGWNGHKNHKDDFKIESNEDRERCENGNNPPPPPPPPQEEDDGEITVCKIIVDNQGNIIDGSGLSTLFSIDSDGPEGEYTVEVETPLDLNEDIVDDNGSELDAYCYTFEDLSAGQYTYEAEEITGDGIWGTPLYNDYYDGTQNSLSDFYELTVDGSEDDNDSADGVINLGENDSRTLVVINTLEERPVQHVCEYDVELIENGGFEEPTVGGDWDYFPEGTAGLAWLVDWIKPLQTPTPANLEIQRNVSGWLPYTGDQYAELDSHGADTNEASVAISQELETVSGEDYTISFAFSPRPNTGESDNELEVYWDGNLIDTLVADGTGNNNTDWTTHEYVVTATSDFTTFTLADGGNHNQLGTLVDDVSVMCGEYGDEEEYPYGIITYPVSDYDVESGMITLLAEYYDGDDDNDDAVQWAVREGTCSANTNTVAGNVDGFSDSYNWDGMNFSSDLDTDLLTPGDYCFVFNPTDDGPVNVRETRWFTIEDEPDDNSNTPPVISLIGDDPIEIELGDSFSDPGATASDVEDGDITGDIVEGGDVVDTNTEGTYVITYNVTDSDGAPAVEVTRTVNVVDNSPTASSRRSSGGSRSSSGGGGEVLGAFTGESCGMYLNTYMRMGADNDPAEVLRLQLFLNMRGYSVPLSGVFDEATDAAVRAFQDEHFTSVISPWIAFGYPAANTGYVYKTTRYLINNLVCLGSENFPVLP